MPHVKQQALLRSPIAQQCRSLFDTPMGMLGNNLLECLAHLLRHTESITTNVNTTWLLLLLLGITAHDAHNVLATLTKAILHIYKLRRCSTKGEYQL